MKVMKYFGTDGMRGRFGEPPIDGVHLSRLARALTKKYAPKRLAMGRDLHLTVAEIMNIFHRVRRK
jgi:phosphomannomutase